MATAIRDLRSTFQHGVLAVHRFPRPGHRRPLRIEYFRLGKLVRAEVDTDRDGGLDTEQTYSALGELRETRRLPEPAPAS